MKIMFNSFNKVFFPNIDNVLNIYNSFSFIKICPYNLPTLWVGSLTTFAHDFNEFLFIDLFIEILKLLRIPKLFRRGGSNL